MFAVYWSKSKSLQTTEASKSILKACWQQKLCFVWNLISYLVAARGDGSDDGFFRINRARTDINLVIDGFDDVCDATQVNGF